MKWVKLLLATIFFTSAVGIGAAAFASPYGLSDSHDVWRDADYWHANHPEWVYRLHPEWAVDRREWWLADHRGHPEWFESPYWRRYPVWTYGAYDRAHVWRDAGWWRERDPAWFYAHHPEWAEAHPGWIRYDHGEHPEWFHSAYWSAHPRDWNHPDEEYRRELSKNVEYQHTHPAGVAAANNPQNYHGGSAVAGNGGSYHAGAAGTEHLNATASQYHAPAAQYHAPASSAGMSVSSPSHAGSTGKH